MKRLQLIQAGIINIVYSIGKDLVDFYQYMVCKPCSRKIFNQKALAVLVGQLSIQMFAIFVFSVGIGYWCAWDAVKSSIPLEIYFEDFDPKAITTLLEWLVVTYVVVFDCMAVFTYQRLKSL